MTTCCLMTQHTAHLAVYDTLADWEFGHLLAELHSGRFTGTRFEVVTVAESRDPITTMGGVRMVPDALLADLEPADSDLLILPGADMWDAGGGEAFAAVAGRFLDAGVPVAAICGATAGLARAGLLDERNHTSAAPAHGSRRAPDGGHPHHVSAPRPADGGRATSRGRGWADGGVVAGARRRPRRAAHRRRDRPPDGHDPPGRTTRRRPARPAGACRIPSEPRPPSSQARRLHGSRILGNSANRARPGALGQPDRRRGGGWGPAERARHHASGLGRHLGRRGIAPPVGDKSERGREPESMSGVIRLVRADADLLDAAIAGDRALASAP